MRSDPSAQRPQDVLADRIRVLLSGLEVREVRMFGGIAFMVDGRMAVSAGREGDLLVRVDPKQHTALLDTPGVRQPLMGDRSMGPGWLLVEGSHLNGEGVLESWVDRSLESQAGPGTG
ncbi:TfoX/Sxy family protein [Streptomyces sp. WAC 04229]|uniref:TfoX/Sxy family protein n=1 Tax=Streptomyces sp. WAC 04229 TaxID=2203206 RepID=UPI003D724882